MLSLFREHPYYPLSLCIILILFAWAGRIDASNPGALPVYDCTTQSEIPEVECDALVALYNST
ncbi:MAG: hypothetical protein KAG66_09755, partial [Methylococcales bacterium]|nr:hypothetical protein [Methylococcales bacterium]